MEASRGHATAAGHPPEAGGRRNRHRIDDLKSPRLEEAARRRIADEDREPVAGIDDEVACKRNEQQAGQEPDTPANLLENFGREG